MLKKIIAKYLVTSFILLLATSCIKTKEDGEVARELAESFVLTIDEKNTSSLKNLFSKEITSSIETFDTDITQLFEYYKGTSTLKKFRTNVVTSGVQDELKTKYYEISYDITTNIDVYRMYFLWYITYSLNEDLVGLWCFYIIRFEDDIDKEKIYFGDQYETPGINIGKVWSYDDRFE